MKFISKKLLDLFYIYANIYYVMIYNRKVMKLNELLLTLPANVFFTSKYLDKFGITDQMIYHYVHNLKLFKSMSHGVYARINDNPTWKGLVWALQQTQDIHVGGMTALEEYGFSHFLRHSDKKRIFLYSSEHSKLPSWVKQVQRDNTIILLSDNFLSLKFNVSEKLLDKSINNELKMSLPERAILEQLYVCPNKVSLKETYQMFEMMINNLRPKLMQELLEKCKSIKVKRLFLYLAEENSPSWFKMLDVSKINLGSGIRNITKGGEFNSKYKIVVDRDIENV